MGQAKQRGTYEQRKAAAIKRKFELAEQRREIATRRQSPKHRNIMALLIGAGLVGPTTKR